MRAAQERAQQQRFTQALRQVGSHAAARTSRVDRYGAQRADTLRTARRQAAGFTAGLRDRSAAHEAAEAAEREAEVQRRRRNQPSGVDFRFSRLHEGADGPGALGGLGRPHPVESVQHVERPPIEDPVRAAQMTAQR